MNAYQLPDLIRQALRPVWDEMVKTEGPKISDAYSKRLKRRIRQQQIGSRITTYWPALDAAYLAEKRRKRLDMRKLIATGAYVRNIRARQVDKQTWVVDVPPTRHRPSKITFRRLARVHEYGTNTIPARPHWWPTTQEFQMEAPERARVIERRITQQVQQRLRRLLPRG